MFTWRRILIGFGIVAGVAYLYLLLLGGPFFLFKRDFRDPAMWNVPLAVPDLAISTSPGLKLSYFGWELEVPWTDLDLSNTKSIGKPPLELQVIGFRSGRQVIFITGPANQWSRVLSRAFSPPAKRWLFGADGSSDYAFVRAMLETTPDQLTPFVFRWKGSRLSLLLMLKSIEIAAHDAKSGIFAIDTPLYRGFQYGNPETMQEGIDDVLYSERAEVELHFRSCPAGKAPISQADINRVIQTLKLSGTGDAH